jgi:hypothetical protein
MVMAQITANEIIMATFLLMEIAPDLLILFIRYEAPMQEKNSIRPHLHSHVSDRVGQET